MTANVLIAVIPRNSIDEIRVEFSEYRGPRFLSLRTYSEIDQGKERVPTKKGITVKPGPIPELRATLEQAEEIARAEGLLG